ncbi:SGNH/GDSL hydrolase family protein [Microbacterium luticocti]|uniref:SGNH/GDSL hydrolase family protein n=1 Tax=Microbacterium luticocti TaxID=451764 RepID=UPI00068850D6|nr:SGNH/GDSL hydrolase family protein [Microbacterium luticocti]
MGAGRRIAHAAGVAAGAAVGLVATVGIVTTAEGLLARERLAPTRLGSVLPHSGVYGAHSPGTPIRLGLMGDSLAVGYGADHPDHTPGVLLARGLAAASSRPVALTNVAAVGAESTALLGQLGHLRELTDPDVVVIVVGANDVMRLKRLTDALWPLAEVVRHLRRDGVQVVVATCPDLGTVHPFSQPLRFFAHWYSRVTATGQAIVVLRAGGRTVSLADTLGPLFRHDPQGMFSPHDHLHPSDAGYRAAADAILPSVCAAAGYPRPQDAHVPHRVYRKGSRHPLAWWAFRASRRVGARLTAAESMHDRERRPPAQPVASGR